MLLDDPDLYDATFRPGARAERHPGPVLDLACGIGRRAVALARAGDPRGGAFTWASARQVCVCAPAESPEARR